MHTIHIWNIEAEGILWLKLSDCPKQCQYKTQTLAIERPITKRHLDLALFYYCSVALLQQALTLSRFNSFSDTAVPDTKLMKACHESVILIGRNPGFIATMLNRNLAELYFPELLTVIFI